MSDFFYYLVKVSTGIAIIFIPYYFLFRNDPNLFVKRIYLLVGLLAAWLFPLIRFQRPDLILNLTPVVLIDPSGPEVQPISFVTSGTSRGITINWIQVLIITHLTGMILMLIKNLLIVFKWNLTWRQTKNEEGIAFTGNNQVFTLFTKIFIPRELHHEQDLNYVLPHEKAHVQQLHFIDLTLMELTLLLTWFNPFSWLISRMIKENHEHLADRQVLSTGIDPARYRAQLLNHTLGVNVFRLGNQFNHSLTLKRFNMMKKPKKSLTGMIKIALFLPAVLFTLGLTTGMTPQQKPVKGKVIIAKTGEPAPGTSIVVKNGTSGCVADIDGNFMLDVEGDPELVFSFVGYANQVLKASEIGKNPIALIPKTYQVDLESGSADNVVLTPEEIKDIHMDSDKKETDEPMFYIVEDMPSFPGGNSALKTYIYSNLEYPESAKSKGKEGEVLVQFTVLASGELTDIHVARSSYAGFDRPAMKVFKEMPNWNPGSQRGKSVQVQVVVPVKFNIAMNNPG